MLKLLADLIQKFIVTTPECIRELHLSSHELRGSSPLAKQHVARSMGSMYRCHLSLWSYLRRYLSLFLSLRVRVWPKYKAQKFMTTYSTLWPKYKIQNLNSYTTMAQNKFYTTLYNFYKYRSYNFVAPKSLK